MATDTLLDKQSILASDTSIEALDTMLQQIIREYKADVALKDYLHAKSVTDVDWDNLQHIRIIGNTHFNYLPRFENIGITRGFYCNEDDSWLLAILPQNQGPRHCLRRCGQSLKTLSVENCFRSSAQLKLEQLTGLTTLRLYRCGKLNAVQGLENLTGLTHLDISWCTELSQLPGLEKLTSLTYLDVSCCDELSQLPGLEKLTSLTYLNVSGCDELSQLPGLEKLTSLTYLNVSGCDELSQLPGIEELASLSYLDVSGCAQLSQLPGLEKLTSLSHLDVSCCDELSQLPGIEKLTSLTHLDVSGCDQLSQLSGIEKLTSLTYLDVSYCDQLSQLSGIEKLTSVTYFNVSGCDELSQLPGIEELASLTYLNACRCVKLSQLPGLEKLTSLTHLDVSGCAQLSQLPGLEKLTSLSHLDVSGCAQLSQLPGIEKLTSLSYLDASGCDELSQLPGIEKLASLSYLDVSGCAQLSQLPSLENLASLTDLYLAGSSLSQLPDGLNQCKNLQNLDLSEMHLTDIPNWLPERFRCFTTDPFDFDILEISGIVGIWETTIDTIPDMSIFDQPYEVVAEWFKKRSLNEVQPLNEIKVVFLGDGEAGKSHTIARLMNDGGDPDHVIFDGQSTPGIVIRNKEYDLGDRKITVHYWDFGGQEIMHSMHRIFLTGRTMYVILLNARDDTQSDRAKYWLHNVKSFAPDAPVLLVLNKIDQNEKASVDERDLRSRYEKLTQVVKLSAKEFNQEKFNARFTNVLLEEIRKTGFLDAQWPSTWTRVKDRLENMQTHYIMGGDYQDICRECKVDDNQKNLLHWFNDLGVSFCCDGEDDYTLDDYVILRPDWITNALYIILFNAMEGAHNGLIPHRSIYNLLKNAHTNQEIRCTLPQARYSVGDIQYVLGIMRKFNLSFTDGHENEFIPMLCQQNSMLDVQYYQKDAEILEFNMEFDYLPNNLLHRLMVERYSELDMTIVWRTGAQFQMKELGYSAVVVIDGNTLRFFISHTDPMHRPNTYLTMLKAHVDRIVAKMGLQPPSCQLVYKLDGKRDSFDFELLKMRLEVGQTHELAASHRKLIPIQDILNQSAPDGLEDEKRLLDAIKKSCINIQAEPDYYLRDGESGWGMEDKRNRRIRDDLQMLGYDVKDQTQRGLSGTGRGIGELDLLLLNDRKDPWTIIEALRVSSGTKTEWNKHLEKLVANYNYFGASCLYLLTYVDSDEVDFQRIWDGYQRHIPKINPGKFIYCSKSMVSMNAADDPRYVKIAKCQYDCGDQTTTAYHIFVRIPRQG